MHTIFFSNIGWHIKLISRIALQCHIEFVYAYCSGLTSKNHWIVYDWWPNNDNYENNKNYTLHGWNISKWLSSGSLQDNTLRHSILGL